MITISAGLLLCAASYVLFFYEGFTPLRRANIDCLGCHVQSVLKFKGPIASSFSKGVHAINRRFIGGAGDLTGKDCANCHQQVHKQWQSSAHGRAFTNVLFRRALEHDRKAWCINCHAPLWREGEHTIEELATKPDLSSDYAAGITCAVCHVRDDRIYGPNDYSGEHGLNFHPVYYDPTMSTADFCAGCHQFNFTKGMQPTVAFQSSPAMQDTIGEHERSMWPKKGASCKSCHFRDGNHSLHIDGKGNDLRDSIKVDFRVERQGAGMYLLHASVVIPALGHSFPTGDLFRVFSLYAYDSRGKQIMKYDFRRELRVVDRELISDTTLKPNKQGVARKDLQFMLEHEPVRCLATYRLQGAIEPRISTQLKKKHYRRDYYSGSCTGMKL